MELVELGLIIMALDSNFIGIAKVTFMIKANIILGLMNMLKNSILMVFETIPQTSIFVLVAERMRF